MNLCNFKTTTIKKFKNKKGKNKKTRNKKKEKMINVEKREREKQNQ